MSPLQPQREPPQRLPQSPHRLTLGADLHRRRPPLRARHKRDAQLRRQRQDGAQPAAQERRPG